MTTREDVTCVVCGKTVPRKNKLQVTCGDRRCVWTNGNPEPSFKRGATFRCAECGRETPIRNSLYRICGAPECKRARAARHNERYRVRQATLRSLGK